METQSVAIVIVNWNNYIDTTECLKSLDSLNYEHFKVFLVDNGSSDDSHTKLYRDINSRKYRSAIEFIGLSRNLGFAGGNNVAIKKAIDQSYEYIWMLNNDTVIDSNALSELMREIISNEQIGIVGSKIYYYGTNKIWFAGGLINTWTGNTTHLGFKKEENGRFENKRFVDYITGCSMLFKKEVVNDIGFMDESFFMYYEETEYNLRASKNKWRIVYVPTSIIYHKVSSVTGRDRNTNPIIVYYKLRNAFWMIYKTQGKSKVITSYLYLNFRALKSVIKVFLYNQNRKSLRFRLIGRAIKDALKT